MIEKQITFDVSGLIPEAQNAATAVARIFWKHTQPWFIGLTCFGSAVKGGFIPGASDSDLAHINPAPFRYIDGGAERGPLPEGHIRRSCW